MRARCSYWNIALFARLSLPVTNPDFMHEPHPIQCYPFRVALATFNDGDQSIDSKQSGQLLISHDGLTFRTRRFPLGSIRGIRCHKSRLILSTPGEKIEIGFISPVSGLPQDVLSCFAERLIIALSSGDKTEEKALSNQFATFSKLVRFAVTFSVIAVFASGALIFRFPSFLIQILTLVGIISVTVACIPEIYLRRALSFHKKRKRLSPEY